MKYRCEVVINRPRDEVVTRFDSLENLYRWQPTLMAAEAVSGAPGQVGSTMKLTYRNGRRTMTMVETITAREFPDRFDATYTAGGVVNPCRNRFEDSGEGTTRWIMDTEFQFSGMMAVAALFMRKAFPRETRSSMEQFKAWIEST